ncbi:chromosome segregation protein SMC [Sporosarcina aquimarina]|uniref:Chromosome partition protein Smc n=1 Tax=Sporosarcina aquimarina TaxID=114975 RepID=A0ABU4FX29_9BACL|nr:chromosome segregation protein SMC [Sporosarcina aquimarina]MDW0109259.1 chromosome segregation protein SMC [Sporosarcina aquimarina]
MFLKRLEIIGFKSFAEKVSIEFVPGVTAVVGPNGSGKSNVIDAIRWVLGEQSAKSLRGAKMQDVIFAGSDSRKPLNFAEVTLILDNTMGLFPLDYTEISVSRRVFRSGESSFQLNGQTCRLKDINDVFVDSGLGKEAFSIISQGRVDEILNSRPEDRRSIFDEAAGVLKYRMRKKKAEFKLIETDDNLDRILDILKELDDRMEPLAENAKAAERHEQLVAELRDSDVRLLNVEASHLQSELLENKNSVEEKTVMKVELEKEASTAEHRLQLDKATLANLDKKISDLQEQHVVSSSEAEKWEGRRLLSLEKQRNVNDRSTRLSEDLDSLKQQLQQLEVKKAELTDHNHETELQLSIKTEEMTSISRKLKRSLAETEQEIENLKSTYIEVLNEEATVRNELKHIGERLAGEQYSTEKTGRQTEVLRSKLDKLTELKEQQTAELETLKQNMKEAAQQAEMNRIQLKKTENQLTETQTMHQQAVNKRYELQGRLRALKSMEADFSGFYSGVKEVLVAKQADTLQGIEGAVAELISVDKKHMKAVETALGGAMQHIIATTERHARAAIGFLKKKNAGRATFLPLDVMKARYISKDVLSKVQQHPDFIGTGEQLVNVQAAYRNVAANLLGATIIAKTLNGASEIAKLSGYRFRVVTLDGDVVNAGGSLTGGGSKVQSTVFSRKAELETLTGQLDQLNHSIAAAEEKLSAIKLNIAGEMQKASVSSTKTDELQVEITRLDSYLQETTFEIRTAENEWKTIEAGRRGSEDTRSALVAKREELHLQSERLAAQQQELQTSVASLERLAADRRNEEQTLRERYSELREETAILREQVTNRSSLATAAEQELQDAKRKFAQTEEELQFLTSQEEGEVLAPEEIEKRISEETQIVANVRSELVANRSKREQLALSCDKQEAALKQTSDQIRFITSELSNLNVAFSRNEVKLESVLIRLLEDYGLHPDYKVPEDFNASETRIRVEQLKREIESLGPVNPGAVEEYKEVLERHTFLTDQRNDLLEAKTTLEEAMSEMDLEMKTRFSSTFEAVQQRFRTVFKEMFGGGEADLVLTNPENLLETGVDIIARPPGKKLQNLSLLSGGERALTAITLLFSIIEVRPVPFCILDEVEAALDEANVIRYSRYLKKFSEDTQFIVITHRKGTMEGADVLYGITMQESGVSRLLSVKMSEVPETALSTP